MKRWMGCVALGMLGLWACEQAEDGENGAQGSGLTECVIQELQHTDDLPVDLTQTYQYDAQGRLVAYRMVQRYTAVETEERTEEVRVAYADRQVTVSDEAGNTWVYALAEDQQAAEWCVYTSAGGSRRSYRFTYAGVGEKCYLTGVQEFLDGEAQPFASLDMDYALPQQPVLTKRMNGYTQRFQLDCSAAHCKPNRARLPIHFYTELYPLSQHHVALYGHLLGDAPDVLPCQVITLDSPWMEHAAYDYHTENGWPVSCKISHSGLGVRTLNFQVGK